jgi:hypothetical protein
MISNNKVGRSDFLGPVIESSFNRATVLARMRAGADGLVLGSFAVMLRHASPQGVFEGLEAPDAGSLQSGGFIVLRLLKAQALPEPESRLGRRCDLILASAEAGDASDASDANHVLLIYELLGAYLTDGAAGAMRFSGDPGSLAASEQYCAFLPTGRFLDTLTNGVVNPQHRIHFGKLRTSESQVGEEMQQDIVLSMLDIRGKRTAVFGKTRLGKSNAVKLVVQGMLDVTAESQNVGQLIFDVNGEYANDNPQDGNLSIASIYQDRCMVYFLAQRDGNKNGKLLRFNFYEKPHQTLEILSELLSPAMAASDYVQPLLNCRIPDLYPLKGESEEKLVRRVRKVMMLWAVLDAAGFEHDEPSLARQLTGLGLRTPFNPHFPQTLRNNVYQSILRRPTPTPPSNFRDLMTEMAGMASFMLDYANDPGLIRNDAPVFDLDEQVMAQFLNPKSTIGPYVLSSCRAFHSPLSSDFVVDVLAGLAAGKTAIIDLGSAGERIVRYFSKTLSTAVFKAQEAKFVSNQLGQNFVQIYFEEAHMIFPPSSGEATDIYSRFAKEGAKFHIGIAYSTQSPSSVNKDLLAQTENFFIGHLSARPETDLLSSVQHAFHGQEEALMNWRSPGLMRVMTYSHRYPLPVQVARFNGESLLVKDSSTGLGG